MKFKKDPELHVALVISIVSPMILDDSIKASWPIMS